MSGHSKWSTIKHKKGAADAKRGKIFTKIAKEIIVAVRAGGPAEETNAALRACIIKARASNMPKDNVERAIKRGVGGNDGVDYTQIIYEGYAPGGIALLIDTLTDNKNRTVSDVKAVISKANGSFGTSGSVSYLFNRKGVIDLEINKKDEDRIFELALDAGADDVIVDDNFIQIISDPDVFENVVNAVEKAGFETQSAEVKMVPSTTIQTDKDTAEKVLRLIDRLEDIDDVQSVSSNLELPDDFEV